MIAKKYYLYISIGLISVLLALILILRGGKATRYNEPFRAIPLDAAVIIQVNDFEHLIQNFNKNKVWTELTGIESLGRLKNQIGFIDSLAQVNKIIRSLIQNNPFFISMNVTGKGSLNYTHVFKLPKGLNEKSFSQIIKNLIENEGTMVSRKYEGFEIFDIRLLDEKSVKNFSYSVARGLLIFSFSPLLVEDALRQMSLTQSVYTDKEFVKIYNTAGKNVDVNVFVNFRHVPEIAGIYLKPEYRNRLLSTDDLAGWAALDFNLPGDAMLLNGFTAVSDSAQQISRLFLNQSPSKITLDDVLPANVSSYVALSFSDENLYLENFKNHLTHNGRINDYNRNLNLLKNRYNCDINDVFYSLINKEIALVFEAYDANKSSANAYVVINTKSKSQAEKKLRGLIEKITSVDKKNRDEHIFNYKIDNELSFPIYKMPYPAFIKNFLGGFFNYPDISFFTFIDNYLVFGQSVETLSRFIHSNILNRTLITDPSYREFKSYLSPRTNLTFYCDLGKSYLNYSEFLQPEIVKAWERNLQVFQKAKVLGFQFSPQKQFLYTNVFIKGISEYSDKPKTVWESLLDTTLDFKPQFVINHNTRQTEIFLQDNNSNIYLINQVGRILWKQNLSEKIKSNIYQVDYYSNGKLQLMFSTENYLHLLDRNGNYVERYPVRLRSQATNGMALFDYDNNRNYRIFIACSDNRVYAYDKEGNIIKGWDPENTESEVTQPVNHFRVKDRDYIVYGDRLNTYILDRKGNRRVEVKEIIARSQNNNYYFEPSDELNNSYIVFTDTAGMVYKIFPDERIVKSELLRCSPNHFFDFKDIDGDGNKDFIFLDDNKLTVFGHDKTKLFSYETDTPIDLSPVYYHFSVNDRKIGLVSKKKCLIFLINNDGSLYKGFPLRGCTHFSIGYLGSTISHFNLITGGDNNFLYNYAVQ